MAFEKDTQVALYQCDLQDRMTMGDILRQVQQISTDHCNSVGMTTEKLQQNGVAFVMVKVSVECYHPMLPGQQLHFVTRPSWPVRAVYHRFTTLSDPDGRELCSVDARWCMIDPQARRILRTPPESLDFPFLEQVERSHDIAIQKPETLEPVGLCTATYSRTDRNGHLNNTNYADCICDALPLEEMSTRPIAKMVIHYNRELKLGEEMELFRGKTGENTYYLCGKRQGATCFESAVTLAPTIHTK